MCRRVGERWRNLVAEPGLRQMARQDFAVYLSLFFFVFFLGGGGGRLFDHEAVAEDHSRQV